MTAARGHAPDPPAAPCGRLARRLLGPSLLAAMLVVAGAAAAPELDDIQSPASPPAPALRPLLVDIEVVAPQGRARLDVQARVSFEVRRAVDAVVLQLRRDFEIEEVLDDSGERLSVHRAGKELRVAAAGLSAGERRAWTFRYVWPLSAPVEELPGLYTAEPWYPHPGAPLDEGFPRWAPSRARIAVELPPGLVAASTGHLTTQRTPRGRRFVWNQPRELSLHALAIGPFHLRESREDDLLVRGFFLDADGERADRFLDLVRSALEFYSHTLAPYPGSAFTFAELSLPPGLKGLSLPGFTLLSTAVSGPETPFPRRILAHEIAHNWWSFDVDFPDPADYWLKEGLPTYSAMLYLERAFGRAVLRDELERSRRLALLAKSPQPLAAGFSRTSADDRYLLGYHKAAMVLHMLRTIMGRDGFVAALHDLHRGATGRSATGAELRAAVRAHHDDPREIAEFFRTWVDEPVVPRFEVRYTVERAGVSPPLYRLLGTIRQVVGEVRMRVLLRVELEGAPPLEREVDLEGRVTSFAIDCPSRPQAVELDPHGDLLHAGIEVIAE